MLSRPARSRDLPFLLLFKGCDGIAIASLRRVFGTFAQRRLFHRFLFVFLKLLAVLQSSNPQRSIDAETLEHAIRLSSAQMLQDQFELLQGLRAQDVIRPTLHNLHVDIYKADRANKTN